MVRAALRRKRENVFLNLLFNIVIPVWVLTRWSRPDQLGPWLGLGLALLFPISYGTWELIRERKWNVFSTIGLVSVLLTGGFALLKLDGFWFAVKEAMIPFVIGCCVLGLKKVKIWLREMVFLNPQFVHLETLEKALVHQKTRQAFHKLLQRSTWFLSSSFFLSAVLNFILARYLIRSPAGTETFNQELGRLTAWSFPIIAVPSMVVLFLSLIYFFSRLKKLTGIDFFENKPPKEIE